MKFDWDSKKAEANRRKHGVSFDEAATVFLDPHAVSGPDPDHSAEEERYITFGCSKLGRLLAVSHLPAGYDAHYQCTPPDTRRKETL